MRKNAIFYLNGALEEVGDAKAGWMLADYLRVAKSLTGTKIVCAEGDCGACTVLRFFPSPPNTKKQNDYPLFLPINACITTVAQMDGSSLVTIDALARAGSLTPTQKAMRDCHGSQCGFCTPGIVMALSGLVEKRLLADKAENADQTAAKIGAQEARNALTGNLCRCTGYQQILAAAQSIDLNDCESLRNQFFSSAQKRHLLAALSEPLEISSEHFCFQAPLTFGAAARALAKTRDAKLLAAGTDLGVHQNKGKNTLATPLLSLHLIAEAYEMKTLKGRRLRIGARVTLAELRQALKTKAPEIARFLDIFASPQIKNSATLIGNLANASPIADTPPFLLACDAVVEVVSGSGERSKRHEIPIQKFFLGYRRTALKKGELISAVTLQLPDPTDSFALYKASERKDLDIAVVNLGIRLSWKKGRDGRCISEARLALGGVAPTPLRLEQTENLLFGKRFTPAILEAALASLHREIAPISDLRGSCAYRHVLAERMLRAFFRVHGEQPAAQAESKKELEL